jgi:hypothetical protein
MQYPIVLFFAMALISCNNRKENMANNRGPNDPHKMEYPIQKDTIDVYDIIERNTEPKKALDGGESEEVLTSTIVKYDDANKDTINVAIKVTGIIHPPAIGNPPPKKPFERLEQFKFYKANGEWEFEKR